MNVVLITNKNYVEAIIFSFGIRKMGLKCYNNMKIRAEIHQAIPQNLLRVECFTLTRFCLSCEGFFLGTFLGLITVNLIFRELKKVFKINF